MNSARDSVLRSDDEEDLVFDQTGLLTNKVASKRAGLSRTFVVNSGGRITVARTVNLCLSFFGLGLCFAIPTATLDDLQQSTRADRGSIEYIFTARHGGYILGCLLGGFLFDCYNRQFLLFLSLLATSVGIIVMPFCTQLATLMACTAVTGLTMGFLDTGGNVWCLDLWGRQSAPFMQALHFCFGLGALVAPLVAEPFLPVATFAGSPGAVGENVSEFVHVPRVSHLGLHHPAILTVHPNQTWRHKRDVVANETLETFNVTVLQVDVDENATLLYNASSGNVSEVSSISSTATPVNISSAKKPMKPKYTEAQHQDALWDRKSQKGPPQNLPPPPPSPPKNSTVAVEKNGTVAKNVSSSPQENVAVSNESLGLPLSNTTMPANKSASPDAILKPVVNSISSTSSWSSSDLSPSVPAATSGVVVATVYTSSTSPLATTRTDVKPTDRQPSNDLSITKQTSERPEETTSTEAAPVSRLPAYSATSVGDTTTPSFVEEGFLPVYTANVGREGTTTTTTAFRDLTSVSEDSQDPVVPTKVPVKIPTKSNEDPTSVEDFNATWPSGKFPDRKWWFSRNRFQIAYVILGLYLFLVAAVFLAFLCASPRESRSRQDEDAVRVGRPGSQKGLVLLAALFFFFYMVLEADVGELLHVLPAERSPVAFAPGGYFPTYVFWGSFAAARGFSVALATKLSCRAMLVGDLAICLLASVLLVAGGDRMDLLLWSGVGVLGLGMASILPTTLVWLERHIKVTNRTASVLLLSAALGELVLTVLANNVAQHERAVLTYINVAVVTLCCLNFAALWLAGSKRGEKYGSHPDRSLYQLASLDEEDVVELNGARPLWDNGVGGELPVKRKRNGSV